MSAYPATSAERITPIQNFDEAQITIATMPKKQDGEIAEFREGLWTGLLDYATIYADGRMTFTFKTGQTIDG